MNQTKIITFLNQLLAFANKLVDAVIASGLLLLIVISLWGMYTPVVKYTKPKTLKQQDSTTEEQFTVNNEETFEELREQYPDIVGWLTIDGTNIDYPIVQGKDNAEYLNKSADGSSAIAGSIFMDYRNAADFSDFYTLIYGHHMSHENMFGHITDFLDADFFEKYQEGTLYLPDGNYKICFFAATITTAYDDTIYSPFGYISEESQKSLLEHIRSIAEQYRDVDLDEARIIGLSTCYSVITDGRAILYGYLKKV